MSDCLFCKFVSGEIPVQKVYEDNDFIIIKDIAPMAKNHYLAIPKIHFKLLEEMDEQKREVLSLSTYSEWAEIEELLLVSAAIEQIKTEVSMDF